MPIAKRKLTAPIPNQPIPTPAQVTKAKLIAHNSNDAPVESLVAYMDGMPWTVNYYRQLLGEHSNIRELDSGINVAQQQYEQIVGLELRVKSALQPSYDSESAFTSVSGSAIIYPVIPNINDYIVADASTNDICMLRVTSVERLSHNAGAVYLISYDMVAYARDDTVLYDNLRAKAIRSLYFSKDRLIEGKVPVLREKDYNTIMDLGQSYQELLDFYLQAFFRAGLQTLMVPDQSIKIYDAWLVDFIRAITDSTDNQILRVMKQVSLDGEAYASKGSIWTALLQRNYNAIKRVYQKAAIAPRNHFNKSSWLRGPIYWPIDAYIYPVLDDATLYQENMDPEIRIYAPAELLNTVKTLIDPEYDTTNIFTVEDGTTIPLFNEACQDGYYVLSESFYQGTSTSALEVMVTAYLKGAAINQAMLSKALGLYYDLPRVEQFYYGPLLLLLIKTQSGEIY